MQRLDVVNTRVDGGNRWRTVDEFFQTYWSGLDCKIYADDVWLDDIIQLSWDLQEAVMPVFGYADYTARTFLRGARQVKGTFTINFKRAGYIYQLLQELSKSTSAPVPEKAKSLESIMVARTGNTDSQTFIDVALAGGLAVKDSKGRLKMSLSDIALLTQEFENAVWDSDPSKNRGATTFNSEQLSLKGPRFGTVDGSIPFDLYIQFGSVDPAEIKRRALVGSLSGSDSVKKDNRIPVYTKQKLVGLEINGMATEYNDDGKPILEHYSFLATDAL